jgi:hypothetical protein
MRTINTLVGITEHLKGLSPGFPSVPGDHELLSTDLILKQADRVPRAVLLIFHEGVPVPVTLSEEELRNLTEALIVKADELMRIHHRDLLKPEAELDHPHLKVPNRDVRLNTGPSSTKRLGRRPSPASKAATEDEFKVTPTPAEEQPPASPKATRTVRNSYRLSYHAKDGPITKPVTPEPRIVQPPRPAQSGPSTDPPMRRGDRP